MATKTITIKIPRKKIDSDGLQKELEDVTGFLGFSLRDDLKTEMEIVFHFSETTEVLPTVDFLKGKLEAHKGLPAPKALIFDHLPLNVDPKKYDFTILGLIQKDWTTDRGRRIERLYVDSEGKTAVRDKFIYTNSTNGWVKSYTRTIEWLNSDGSIAMSKVLKSESGYGNISKLNRIIRNKRIDYLFDEGEALRDLAKTLPEPSKTKYIEVADGLDSIYQHYESDIRRYVERGIEFKEKIISEADANIKKLLDTQVPKKGDQFWTVRDSILYTITEVTNND